MNNASVFRQTWRGMSKLNERWICFHFSIDVKAYHADCARAVILIITDDQISLIALSWYLLAESRRAVIMEKGQPMPRALFLAEKEGAGIAFRMAKTGTKT